MDLYAYLKRLGALALLPAAAVACGGCSSTQARPNWVRNMVFWEEREADPRFKITPSEQVELLRKHAATVSTLPPEEQNQVAQQMNEAYHAESDPLLRREMVLVSAACASPTAAETLTAALSDSEREIREAACTAWARHGGPQAIPKLAETMKRDADLNVRLAAVRALAKIGGSDAVTAVAPALEDPDPAMQYGAVKALRTMTGKDFGDDANAWREYVRGGSPAEISVVERLKLKTF